MFQKIKISIKPEILQKPPTDIVHEILVRW
jgi:hypothetical protein